MAELIRVYNPNKFDVGIKKMDGNSANVKAGSFAMLSAEEIQWISSISPLFEKGILRVDQQKQGVLHEVGIHVEDNPNVLTDEQIRAELGKTAKSIKNWLGAITEPFVLAHIAEIAMEMDLTKSKIDALSQFVKLNNNAE